MIVYLSQLFKIQRANLIAMPVATPAAAPPVTLPEP